MTPPCAVRRDEARYQKEWDEDEKRSEFKDGLHDIISYIDDLVTSSNYTPQGISILLMLVRIKYQELQERIVKEME
jgi:hypothetical protein